MLIYKKKLIWFHDIMKRKVSDHPESFQTIRKVSRPSGNFLDHPESFQTIQKLSRLSGNFPDHPESFQTIRKLSRPSGNFPDHPETFQTIRKLSRPSGNFPVQFQGLQAKTLRMRKNFPNGNARMPRWFLCLCPWRPPWPTRTPGQLKTRNVVLGIAYFCNVYLGSCVG